MSVNELNMQKINLAKEFANKIIGNGLSIINSKTLKPYEKGAIHTITINCNGKKLKKIGNKDYYPNWFLDSKKLQNGYPSDLHKLFKKTIYNVLNEKCGENHKLFIKFITVDESLKIFSIEFHHLHTKSDSSEWITHST